MSLRAVISQTTLCSYRLEDASRHIGSLTSGLTRIREQFPPLPVDPSSRVDYLI